MQALIDQLFGTDRVLASEAAKTLQRRGATSAADAEAVLASLAREVPPDNGVYGLKHRLLATIQSCRCEGALEVFQARGTLAIVAAFPQLKDCETFALKMLALLDTREGLSFLAERLKAEDGPRDFFVSTALGAVRATTQHAGVLFPALEPVLAFPDFRAIAVLDLANRLALNRNLPEHPAARHLGRLRALIESREKGESSYATSATLALAFVPTREAEDLLLRAEEHIDVRVRLEALYSLVRRGAPGSAERLAAAARHPDTAQRAIAYLRELGKAELIPSETEDPAFAAKAEMIRWLSHPLEYGRPPASIELWDRRKIYWPPSDDVREMFLFRFTYPPHEPGQARLTGVGLVGSLTFSLMGQTAPSASGTVEDALAAHCVWELEQNGDSRGKGRRLEVGRKLLGFDLPAGR